MARVKRQDYQLLAEFRYALRLFLGFSERAALSAGLKPQQHQALLAIKGFPGRDRVSVGELAERLQVRHHSAVGLVDRLERQGLLSRERSEQDARRVLLAVTPRGETLLADLSAAHQEELRRLRPHLTSLLERLGPGPRQR
jgi:DNA-binding MarR family transcriptional regulator